jgi:hypothetical protein
VGGNPPARGQLHKPAMPATPELDDADFAALLKHAIAADPFPLSRRFDLLLYLVGDFVVVARHGFELDLTGTDHREFRGSTTTLSSRR